MILSKDWPKTLEDEVEVLINKYIISLNDDFVFGLAQQENEV